MCLRLPALLFVLVFSLASSAQTSEKVKADSVPDTCPVTKPSDKPFVPLYPHILIRRGRIHAVRGSVRIGFGRSLRLHGEPATLHTRRSNV